MAAVTRFAAALRFTADLAYGGGLTRTMPALTTAIDPRSTEYAENRAAMCERLGAMISLLAEVTSGGAGVLGAGCAAGGAGGGAPGAGGGARGGLVARERLELVVDRDTPLLELSPTAGWEDVGRFGAPVVTAIGVVCGQPCVLAADVSSAGGRPLNPASDGKLRRAFALARANRLAIVDLVEPGVPRCGARAQHEVALGTPRVTVSFGTLPESGSATDIAAAGLSDYVIVTSDGGLDCDQSPPGDDQPAPAVEVADFVAADDRDAIRLARSIVARFYRRPARRVRDATFPSHGPGGAAPPPAPGASLTRTVLGAPGRVGLVPLAPRPDPAPPGCDQSDLLAIVPCDPLVSADPREVLARVLDGSRFDEFKPGVGRTAHAGWGMIHGYPVAVLAPRRAEPLGVEEVRKGRQFIVVANASETPLFLLGTAPEPATPVEGQPFARDALRLATVPVVEVRLTPAPPVTDEVSFRFVWPGAEASASVNLTDRDDLTDRDGAMVPDDGVIDPRDTRTVLGMCLAVIDYGRGARSPLVAGASPTLGRAGVPADRA